MSNLTTQGGLGRISGGTIKSFRAGSDTLDGGVATILDGDIKSDSVILATAAGGNEGHVSVTDVTAGTSFELTSDDTTAGSVNYLVLDSSI